MKNKAVAVITVVMALIGMFVAFLQTIWIIKTMLKLTEHPSDKSPDKESDQSSS